MTGMEANLRFAGPDNGNTYFWSFDSVAKLDFSTAKCAGEEEHCSVTAQACGVNTIWNAFSGRLNQWML